MDNDPASQSPLTNNLENLETANTQQPVNSIEVQEVNALHQYEFKHKSTALKIALVCGGLTLLTIIIGLGSSDGDFINGTISAVGLLAIPFALSLGIYSAQQIKHSIEFREQYGGKSNKILVIGYVLTLLSLVTGLLTLLPGLIMIFVGMRQGPDLSGNLIPTKPKNKFVKIILITLGFLGGAIPALIISFFGAFMLWNHWCNVTNSKCM